MPGDTSGDRFGSQGTFLQKTQKEHLSQTLVFSGGLLLLAKLK